MEGGDVGLFWGLGAKDEAGDLECGVAELNGESFGKGYLGGRSKRRPTAEKAFITDDRNRAGVDLKFQTRAEDKSRI